MYNNFIGQCLDKEVQGSNERVSGISTIVLDGLDSTFVSSVNYFSDPQTKNPR